MTSLPDPISQSDFYADVTVKRFLAWCFDSVIILIVAFVSALLTLGIAFFFFFALWAVVAFLYRWVSISARSATPGMRLMGIELRNSKGEKLDGFLAMLHTAGTMFSFGTMVQIGSIILMIFSPRGQGLVDMVLGTTMLNKAARY